MSSAKKSHQTSKSVSSTPPTDDQTSLVAKPPSSAENAMDQPLDSTVIAIPPAPPIPSETMSSTDSPSTDVTPTPPTPPSSADSAPSSENDSLKLPALRQQPIPPASEPMQYRAIGLIRGKYQASDEQFTRGEIVTDDGVAIGAVLLGRVMSLVKKHLDLEQSHLWVVYPRTREKGDGNLHVQIVGVWEPENLNRVMEASEPDDENDETAEEELAEAQALEPAEEPADEAVTAPATAAPVEPAPPTPDPEAETIVAEAAEAAETAEAAEVPEVETAADLPADLLADSPEPTVESLPASAEPQPATAPNPAKVTPPDVISADANPAASETTSADTSVDETTSPVATDELDDRYFSVRGEVIYQSLEDNRLLVKIRRSPRPGVDEDKAFKVVLVGALEGKAVGYFWDLHVQREGNMLVVQEGTMIGAVPPQKRGKKPPFNKRRGGGGGRRPPGAGGPPRKRWQNREGQQRPSRSGSDRPTPPQNRGENRSPSPRPIKRRNVDNPET